MRNKIRLSPISVCNMISVKVPKTFYRRMVKLRAKNFAPVAVQVRQAVSEYLARNEALEKRVDSVINKQEE